MEREVEVVDLVNAAVALRLIDDNVKAYIELIDHASPFAQKAGVGAKKAGGRAAGTATGALVKRSTSGSGNVISRSVDSVVRFMNPARVQVQPSDPFGEPYVLPQYWNLNLLCTLLLLERPRAEEVEDQTYRAVFLPFLRVGPGEIDAQDNAVVDAVLTQMLQRVNRRPRKVDRRGRGRVTGIFCDKVVLVGFEDTCATALEAAQMLLVRADDINRDRKAKHFSLFPRVVVVQFGAMDRGNQDDDGDKAVGVVDIRPGDDAPTLDSRIQLIQLDFLHRESFWSESAAIHAIFDRYGGVQEDAIPDDALACGHTYWAGVDQPNTIEFPAAGEIAEAPGFRRGKVGGKTNGKTGGAGEAPDEAEPMVAEPVLVTPVELPANEESGAKQSVVEPATEYNPDIEEGFDSDLDDDERRAAEDDARARGKGKPTSPPRDDTGTHAPSLVPEQPKPPPRLAEPPSAGSERRGFLDWFRGDSGTASNEVHRESGLSGTASLLLPASSLGLQISKLGYQHQRGSLSSAAPKPTGRADDGATTNHLLTVSEHGGQVTVFPDYNEYALG